MQIHKIYISNFKGIHDHQIIDLSSYKMTLLTGPNGFGKTTIFDALEICFLEKISRAGENKTTDGRSPSDDVFYRHDENKRMVIKLLLENNEGEKISIIKYLSAGAVSTNIEGAFNNIKTFQGDIEDFDNEDEHFVKNNIRINNQYISKFIGFKDEKIKDLYRIFNYIQQEETLYFLKKSSGDKKRELNFMFNIEDSKEKYDKLKEYHRRLKSVEEVLKTATKKRDTKDEIITPYKKLFKETEYPIEFDAEGMFNRIDVSSSEEYKNKMLGELEKIISFRKIFSPEDFELKNKHTRLSRLANENQAEENTSYYFLRIFVLQKFLNDSEYNKLEKEHRLLNDDDRYYYYILQKYVSNGKSEYHNLVKNNERIDFYRRFTSLKKDMEQIDEYEKLSEFSESDVSEGFLRNKEKLELLEKSNEEKESFIKDLIELRDNLRQKHEQSVRDQEKRDGVCIYCGHDWESYNQLIENFNSKKQKLESQMSDNGKQILKITNEIKSNYLTPRIIELDKYLQKNKPIDKEVLDKIWDLSSYTHVDISDIKNKKKYQITRDLHKYDLNAINEKADELMKEIIKESAFSNKIFETMRKLYLNKSSYEDYVEFIKEELSEDIDLSKFIASNWIDVEDLTVKKDELKKEIRKKASNIKFNKDKIEDPDNIFDVYFGKDKGIYQKITLAKLNEKKNYIKNQYNKKNNVYQIKLKSRQRFIEDKIEEIKGVPEKYDEIIKAYKAHMVGRIKIPFFLYTAQMLQNYQQGMGVFINVKENSSEVSFSAGTNAKKNDAIHHLSSGQLSVVALSFTLALNKVYQQYNSKILFIDDPIQEMDSLNIHSFIELIRNEFLNDYQILMSTHNDTNALFMKYKFEKYLSESTKIFNVQSEFSKADQTV